MKPIALLLTPIQRKLQSSPVLVNEAYTINLAILQQSFLLKRTNLEVASLFPNGTLGKVHLDHSQQNGLKSSHG